MDVLYFVTFIVAFVSSILSGLAGGGGGFVMAPYWLITGMNPAQGAATGAFMAIGMSASSTFAFRKSGHLQEDKVPLLVLSIIALLTSALGGVIIPALRAETYESLLALITIAALPFLFLKPTVRGRRSEKFRLLGMGLAGVFLVAGSIITSSIFSLLFSLALVQFLGMTFLQMTALRRVIGMVQSTTMFLFLAFQGFFLLPHAVAGILGGSLGSYIGTKYAIKQGENFARYALAGMSVVGALALIT